MIVNENLILKALHKATPGDLDLILTAIESYRLCAGTVRKLVRYPSLESQRRQVAECAVWCEDTLSAFAATGRLPRMQYPNPGMRLGHLVLTLEW